MERLRVSDADPWLGALPGLPTPPPLPDSSGFVAPSVPSPPEALSAFLRALGRDLDGGRRVLGRAAWLLGILLCVTVGGRLYVWLGAASWS